MNQHATLKRLDEARQVLEQATETLRLQHATHEAVLAGFRGEVASLKADIAEVKELLQLVLAQVEPPSSTIQRPSRKDR